MCVDMGAGSHIHVCRLVHVQVHRHLCMDVCIDICIDKCMHMCLDVPRNVYRHVYRHRFTVIVALTKCSIGSSLAQSDRPASRS